MKPGQEKTIQIREHRTLAGRVQLRDDLSANAERCIEGHAAVFFDPAQPDKTQFKLWEYGNEVCFERLLPTAFASSFARPDDVRCLFNHDPNYPLGRRSADANTLTLQVDATGLAFKVELPDTTAGRDVLESIKRQDISGCSFSFRTLKQTWTEETVTDAATGRTMTIVYRTIEDVELFDVGPVTFPAYDGTDVDACAKRSLHEFRLQREDLATRGEQNEEAKQRSIATRRRLRLERLARA